MSAFSSTGFISLVCRTFNTRPTSLVHFARGSRKRYGKYNLRVSFKLGRIVPKYMCMRYHDSLPKRNLPGKYEVHVNDREKTLAVSFFFLIVRIVCILPDV